MYIYKKCTRFAKCDYVISHPPIIQKSKKNKLNKAHCRCVSFNVVNFNVSVNVKM